jgi:hypothetical protein
VITIRAVTPTVLLREVSGGLEQKAVVTTENAGAPAAAVIRAGGQETAVTCPHGRADHDVFVPVLSAAEPLVFTLSREDVIAVTHTHPWQPPRRWRVHVVQLSHHDAGYTDLASHVIPEHVQWLRDTLRYASATADYPEPARFRMVIEQAWSLLAFLKAADATARSQMLALLRSGQFELTATFGNMTTELCGHELLIRTLYPSARLAREHAIPVRTAEHNDIPGFAWGLAEALCDAGVEMICPGLPRYYDWGNRGLASFWDEQAIFGTRHTPGAFWWEAPSGKRLLFWCNNNGCGGPSASGLPGLAARLADIAASGYAYDTIRWPVKGGDRDNSPYSAGYCDTVREWNDTWAWPRLQVSTNSAFLDDLLPQLPAGLPVHRGAVPGQDYPLGAMSTARATTVCRRTQSVARDAEAAACVAGVVAGAARPHAALAGAEEALLWHAEHTWGHHFPAGPTAEAAQLEKALHAHRGETLAYDVLRRSLAAVADAVSLTADGIHLVVFNPTPLTRTDVVRQPLRELDNCGSELVTDKLGHAPSAALKVVILGNRWPVHPDPALVAGRFRLEEVESGETVPHQLIDLDDALADAPHAAERHGLARGGRRYGFFEDPSGLARDLCFVAADLPGMGWRTYRLVPDETTPASPAPAETLANAHYQVGIDPDRGVVSLVDRALGRELLAADGPALGQLIATAPDGTRAAAELIEVEPPVIGPIVSRQCLHYVAPGHPQIVVTISLWHHHPQIDLAAHVLKGPTPLQESLLPFPFALTDATWRLDTGLAVVDPGRDRLPGAFLNRLTVGDWAACSDGQTTVLWSSRESPVAAFGRLQPSRVSPAHSAVLGERCTEPTVDTDGLTCGHLHSVLFANNFGTNFAVAQSGAVLFRYGISSMPAAACDAARLSAFAESASHPLQAIYTKHPGPRELPAVGGLCHLDNPRLRLLACKAAEADDSLVIRLWNPSDQHETATLIVDTGTLTAVSQTDAVERRPTAIARSADAVRCSLPPHTMQTLMA